MDFHKLCRRCRFYTLLTFHLDLRGRVAELERNLSSHEKEIRSQASKLQELQTQLNQTRKELAERDRDMTKTRHELTQANERQQQAETKVGCNCVFFFPLWVFCLSAKNMVVTRE